MKNLFIISLMLLLTTIASCSKPEQAIEEDIKTANKPDTNIAIRGAKPLQTATKQNKTEENNNKAKPAKKVPRPANYSRAKNTNKPFAMRRCINLGNALEANYEGEWGYKISYNDLAAIQHAGFDTIRLPIRWDAHTAHRAPYKIKPELMSRVIEIVKQAQSLGLGVIIDVHHYETFMQNPKREERRFLAIWEQIAIAFQNAPENVYFELLNEPTNQISMSELNSLYAKTVKLIRKTNPKRKIIIGGNSWNSIEAMAKVRWPNYANLVATFHDYSPHEFTHQGAEWTNPKYPLGRKYGTREDLADKKSIYAQARAFKTKTGLPVLVGEFGVIDKVPLSERVLWIKDRRQTIEKNGLAWCVWDFAGAFKTYDKDKQIWLAGMQDALFGK